MTLRPADANEVVEAWKVNYAVAERTGGADPNAASPADLRSHEIPGQQRALLAAPTSWPTPKVANRR